MTRINKLCVSVAVFCILPAVMPEAGYADSTAPPADAVELRQNTPNPFNPHTVITYHIPGPCRVRLEVFDAAGRRVKILADRTRSSGDYSVNWDGRDSQGRQVASGHYFYRMRTERGALTRRLIVIK